MNLVEVPLLSVDDKTAASVPSQPAGQPDDETSTGPADWRRGMTVGYTMLASVLLGLGLGYALDMWFGTMPGCTIGGALLFIVAGLYQVVKEFS